ncbi:MULTISPECIES: acyl-CoA dehydrogenase family protein [Pseudomonas]|uniref:Pimeloyl-CoA dehydrogenase small subunit n=1 Tax=Pseudomonas alloputida TaxID=1940621 RepID=A0ABY3CXJ6_9PSED|nr:acyl-CoA dehydrogenase family protein [Pseudomonas alloputida]MCO6692804.1 acyl-CoA dehydrogenase family protein [Pseudomonas shirazica]TRZ57338.1 pimeloyl-CoA dehydrogenase small subunit [Pseudomonas alloputida]
MDFSLTEEQQMLQDSAARFVGQDYPFDRRQKDIDHPQGFDPELWKKFAGLGWLAVPFSECNGGFGGDATDLMVLMEQLGKGLVATPYLPTILLFGRLLELGATEDLRQDLITCIIDGQLQGGLAFMERQSRYQLADTRTLAIAKGDQFEITGEKALALNGPCAGKLIVSARTSGGQFDEDGISLFLVDADAAGLARINYRLMDGQQVANLRLQQLCVGADRLIGAEGAGLTLLQRVIARAIPAIAAEALGLMNRLTDTTIEYSMTRQQFGVAIGSFQVLQHRMVDMFTACEQVRSLLYRAICSADKPDSPAHHKDLHALKVITGRKGKAVGNDAIQLHGGMGITDELDVGHYVKRLMVLNSLFGDADFHQQQLAALSLTA